MTSAFGCINNTIRCMSGVYFDLAQPRACDVRIEDIATGLSNICRYGGHVPKFYSVAEHSVACANLAIKENRKGNVIRACLLHDAAEAYIGDCVKPLKVMLPEYKDIEREIEQEIFDACDVYLDVPTIEQVRRIDMIMLKAEKIAFFPGDTVEWAGFDSVPHIPFEPQFLTPEDARREFLQLADILEVSTQ